METTHAQHRTVLTVAATAPFDFAASLRFVAGFPALAGEQTTDDGTLVKAVREAGAVVGVRLSARDGEPGVRAELSSATELTPAVLAAVRDRITFFLGLDDDLGAFYALADGDPPFAAVVRRLHGYHHVKFPSPLEMLCWAILSQRVPLPVAHTMKHAVTAACGNVIELDGAVHRAFPDLDQLLAVDAAGWQELVGNTRKAGYLQRALPLWAGLDGEFLRHGDYDEVRAALLRLPGIGPWSASFLMIRGLGRMDRMDPDREGLRAAARVYGRPVGDEEFTRLAAHYGRWQGYWGHYLRVG